MSIERPVIEIAYTEYRRALVDPTSAQPWHALSTELRSAFTKAFTSVWNAALDEAARQCRLANNESHSIHDVETLLAFVQVK